MKGTIPLLALCSLGVIGAHVDKSNVRSIDNTVYASMNKKIDENVFYTAVATKYGYRIVRIVDKDKDNRTDELSVYSVFCNPEKIKPRCLFDDNILFKTRGFSLERSDMGSYKSSEDRPKRLAELLFNLATNAQVDDRYWKESDVVFRTIVN